MSAEPCKTGAWVELVRRAKLTTAQRLVALTVASYANTWGGQIHPGTARLVLETGLAWSTVDKTLTWLQRAGLLERTARARPGRHATFRLVLDADLIGVHLKLPDPGQHRRDIQAEQERHHGRRRPARPVDEPVDIQGVGEVPGVSSGPERSSPGRGANPVTLLAWERSDAPRLGEDHTYHVPLRTPSTSQESGVDQRTDLAVVGTAKTEKFPEKSDTIGETTAQLPLWPRALEAPDVNAAEAKAQIRRTLAGYRRAPMTPYGVAPNRVTPRPADPPPAKPPAAVGFCLVCHEGGRITLAADPVAGDRCTAHLREAAS